MCLGQSCVAIATLGRQQPIRSADHPECLHRQERVRNLKDMMMLALPADLRRVLCAQWSVIEAAPKEFTTVPHSWGDLHALRRSALLGTLVVRGMSRLRCPRQSNHTMLPAAAHNRPPDGHCPAPAKISFHLTCKVRQAPDL